MDAHRRLCMAMVLSLDADFHTSCWSCRESWKDLPSSWDAGILAAATGQCPQCGGCLMFENV